MSSPRPFTIDVPQAKIDRLKRKLAHTEFPEELEGVDWDWGCPLADIKRLVKAWEVWDWRQAEKKLNEAPQFTTDIDVEGFGNLEIHFVHQRSQVEGAVPLLFVHGWPGSFIEVLKILPGLTQNSNDIPSFHVVAPSLPNFGFSQGVSKRGFSLAQYAETCHKLMQRLGYGQYVTQGGDWGYWITRKIGKQCPSSCMASHYNMVYAKPPSFDKHPFLALQAMLMPYTEDEKKGLERTAWFRNVGTGYNVVQSQKPQSVSYALDDSPVGLLAWIYEKLYDWSDAYPWTDEEILTWISIYAFSRAGPGAAHRIYYENCHEADGKYIGVRDYMAVLDFTKDLKIGLTYNPKEIESMPTAWGKTLGQVVYTVRNEKGGHFYAHELPELLVRDVRAMFGKGGGAFGVVPKQNGYGSAS